SAPLLADTFVMPSTHSFSVNCLLTPCPSGCEKPGEVLAAVQDPDNINRASDTTVEDQIIEIIRRGETPQAGSEITTRPSHAGVVSQKAHASHDRVDEPVGSVHTALLGDIEPDCLQISRRCLREAIPGHGV